VLVPTNTKLTHVFGSKVLVLVLVCYKLTLTPPSKHGHHVHDLLISTSVGGVELVEYICADPCLTNCFSEEDPDFVLEDVE
jgi:hypothetical protein